MESRISKIANLRGNLVEFRNEDHLQEFVHSVIGGRREVTFPSGKRIDVLTNLYAVEVKPKLTRDAIYQAMGQLMAYKRFVGDRELVIAGITPKDEKSSISTAKEAKASGISVWYVDKMEIFVNKWHGIQAPANYNPAATEEAFHERLRQIAKTYSVGATKLERPGLSNPFGPSLGVSKNTNDSIILTAPIWILGGIAAFGLFVMALSRPTVETTPLRATPNGPVTNHIPSSSDVEVLQCQSGYVEVVKLIKVGGELVKSDVQGWVLESDFNGEKVCD